MTNDLATKLDAIKDACRRRINPTGRAAVMNPQDLPPPAFQESAARALLVAIEALEAIAKHDHYGGMDARGDLARIAAAWQPEDAKP